VCHSIKPPTLHETTIYQIYEKWHANGDNFLFTIKVSYKISEDIFEEVIDW
jgi:hypothetical protein